MIFFEQTFVDLLLQEQRLFMRVWHYTRLLKCEIKEILVAIRPADTQLLQKKLSKALEAGHINEDEASVIYKCSVLHDQPNERANHVFSTTHPLSINDDGVRPLPETSGGEMITFYVRDKNVKDKLKAIGVPCVIELALPIPRTYICEIAESLIKAYAQCNSWCNSNRGFDIGVAENHDKIKVLRIHNSFDEEYLNIGKTYPYSAIN